MEVKKHTPTGYLLHYLLLLAQQIPLPTTYICWANKSHYLFSSAPFPPYTRCFLPCAFRSPSPRTRPALPKRPPSLPGGSLRRRSTPVTLPDAPDPKSHSPATPDPRRSTGARCSGHAMPRCGSQHRHAWPSKMATRLLLPTGPPLPPARPPQTMAFPRRAHGVDASQHRRISSPA